MNPLRSSGQISCQKLIDGQVASLFALALALGLALALRLASCDYTDEIRVHLSE